MDRSRSRRQRSVSARFMARPLAVVLLSIYILSSLSRDWADGAGWRGGGRRDRQRHGGVPFFVGASSTAGGDGRDDNGGGAGAVLDEEAVLHTLAVLLQQQRDNKASGGETTRAEMDTWVNMAERYIEAQQERNGGGPSFGVLMVELSRNLEVRVAKIKEERERAKEEGGEGERAIMSVEEIEMYVARKEKGWENKDSEEQRHEISIQVTANGWETNTTESPGLWVRETMQRY